MCCMVSLRLPIRSLLFPLVSVLRPAAAGDDAARVTCRGGAVTVSLWNVNGSAPIMAIVLCVTLTTE